jgi:hypothetical protein
MTKLKFQSTFKKGVLLTKSPKDFTTEKPVKKELIATA